jgi:hypothetical protein
MSKKKPTTGASSKKTVQTRRAVEVSYGCWDGACGVSDDALHAGPGDVVVMTALFGVQVTITFTGDSPFESGAGAAAPIVLAPGTSQSEIVKAAQPTNPAKYKYKIKCNPNCGGHAGQPEMIVP